MIGATLKFVFAATYNPPGIESVSQVASSALNFEHCRLLMLHQHYQILPDVNEWACICASQSTDASFHA